MKTYLEHVAAIKTESKWRLIGLPMLVALVVLLVIPGAVQYPLAALMKTDKDHLVSIPGALGMIAAVTLGAWLMARVSKVRSEDLGISTKGAITNWATGGLAGILMLTLVGLVINLLGGTHTVYIFNPSQAGALAVGIIFFMFQGTWEELIYRAYLMPHFNKVMGTTWSVIISSVLFTLFHGLNPGMTFMPILNLMVASVVFSLVYIKTGSLIFTGMAHGMWNFTQGFIFGSQVSGNTTPGSVFESAPLSSSLISGGSFGFEGSIITTLTGVILITVLIVSIRRSAQVHISEQTQPTSPALQMNPADER